MLNYTKIISGLILIQIVPAYLAFRTISPSVKPLRLSTDPACRGKEAGQFVKDPYSCEKFYYCGVNETAVVVDCPYGMIFNDEKEICDFPSNYLCVPRITAEETSTSTTSAETQAAASTREQSSLTTTSGLLTNPSTVINTITTLTLVTMTMTTTTPTATTSKATTKDLAVEINCPLDDSKMLKFLPHPNECNRYYICYHGVPVPQECISELHWNPKTNRCDFPENSACTTPTTIPFTSTEAVSVIGMLGCPFRGEQIYPHPVNCNYFIYCVNGYATVQQCPFYHHFDIRSRQCLWRTVATCTIGNK